ncbi:MAG: hypothetical protein SGARI_003381, partial [Bacillariaceae sp.]
MKVDPDKNNFDVNVAVVNDLIRERGLARTHKQYDKSDAILAELLRDHGVLLNDSHKTWKTGTKKELKKLPKLKLQKRKDIRYRNQYVLSSLAGPHTSPLSEIEILDKIEERKQAQKKKDYNTADRIRNELKRDGVYVEDGLKEWRADGIPFRSRSSSSTSSSRQPQAVALTKSEFSEDILNDDEKQEVEQLLAQRTKFKSMRNYDKSDRLRDQLFESYNIRIDDRLGQWSVGGDFGDDNNSHWAAAEKLSSLGDYIKSPSSAELETSDEQYIQRKVDQRMRAKRTGNYELSDEIRDHLLARYDVTIHDKINQWSVGGDFGPDQTSWTHAGQVRYVVRDGNQEQQSLEEDESSLQDRVFIQAKVDERTQARRDRNTLNIKLAKDIELFLEKTYSVEIDDKRREWYYKYPDKDDDTNDINDNEQSD